MTKSFYYKDYREPINIAAVGRNGAEVFELFKEFFENVFSEYIQRTENKNISLNPLNLQVFANPRVTILGIVGAAIINKPGTASSNDKFYEFLRRTCGFEKGDLDIIRGACRPLIELEEDEDKSKRHSLLGRRKSVVDKDEGKEHKFCTGGHAREICAARDQSEIEDRLLRFFNVVKSTHPNEDLESHDITKEEIHNSLAKFTIAYIATCTGIRNSNCLNQTHDFTIEILKDITKIHNLMGKGSYTQGELDILRRELMADSEKVQKKSQNLRDKKRKEDKNKHPVNAGSAGSAGSGSQMVSYEYNDESGLFTPAQRKTLPPLPAENLRRHASMPSSSSAALEQTLGGSHVSRVRSGTYAPGDSDQDAAAEAAPKPGSLEWAKRYKSFSKRNL